MNIEELKKKYPAQQPMSNEMAEKHLKNIILTGQEHGMTREAIAALTNIQRRIEKLKKLEKEYKLEIGDIEK